MSHLHQTCIEIFFKGKVHVVTSVIPRTSSITYLLTPWSTVLLEKLINCQLLMKFPTFYGTRRFISAFTSARHLSLSWASSIQSTTPHHTSWRSILILSFHLRLGPPKWSLSFRFPHQNPVYASPLPHTRYMLRPSHSSRFYHANHVGCGIQSLSSSLCSFLYSPVTSSLLAPNIFLNTLFSNLSLRSSLNVNDQVSHPYKTTGKLIVLYILNFKFLDSKLEDKWYCTEWHQAFPDFNLPLISSCIEF